MMMRIAHNGKIHLVDIDDASTWPEGCQPSWGNDDEGDTEDATLQDQERDVSKSEDQITVTLSDAEWRQVEQATGEVPYLLSHAANVFEMLQDGISAGHFNGSNGVASVAYLCSRAMRAAADKEGEAIAMLEQRLLNAVGERVRATLKEPDRSRMDALNKRMAAKEKGVTA